MKNYADTEAYLKFLQEFEYIFSREYHIRNDTIKLTDQITLYIEHFLHDDRLNSCAIHCQTALLKDDRDKTIFVYKSVCGYLFYKYIQHANGNEYFIAGSSLNDYVLFNITEHTAMKYVGAQIVREQPHREYTPDLYWYIETLIYNPLNNLLAINGPDILNCSRVAVFEFTDEQLFPFKFYSLSNLIFSYDEGEHHTALGWTDDNRLKVEVVEEKCNTYYLTENEIRKCMQ